MDLPTTDPARMTDAADRGVDMSERIRSAHETAARQDETTDTVSTADAEPASTRQVDGVGAELRARFESIVGDVLATDRTGPDDVLGVAIDALVDDRVERTDVPGSEDYRDQVAEMMRNDPMVVAEIDDVLQTIARQLAVQSG